MVGRSDDRDQILNTVFRYALGLDLSNVDEVIATFTVDGVLDASELGLPRYSGHEELRQFVEAGASAMREQVHINANHIVEFDGDDDAHGTNVMWAESTTRGGVRTTAVFLMRDTYRREAGTWLIAERRATPLGPTGSGGQTP